MSRSSTSPLRVQYVERALADLAEIGDWNEKTYGREHAARYVASLRRRIDSLGNSYQQGSVIESRADLRYIRLAARGRGHCHIAIYRVESNAVTIMHVFHTAQDWQSNFAQETSDR